MTAQGDRYQRYTQWAGSDFGTFDGNQIAAGEVAGGLSGITQDAALRYICAAVVGGAVDQRPLLDYMADAAGVLGVPSGWDAVGLELPLVAWAFTSGGTFPNLTYSSSVAGPISRDSLITVPAGQARASELGLLDETPATNKCTNTNLKPTDTSGTTPDGAWTTHVRVARSALPAAVLNALDAIDPQGNVTGVYRSISNAAGVITIAGATGNTNPHTPSVWHYTLTGDFGCGLSGAGPSASPTAGEWERFEKPGTPAAGTETMVVGSSQASEVYWFGNQLEETTSTSVGRTSLIEISGATASRLGDNVSAPTPAALNTASFTVLVEFQTYKGIVQNSLARSSQLDNGNDTSGQIFYGMVRHTTQSQQLRDDAALALDTASNYTTGTVARHGFGMDGSGNAAIGVNGGNYISGAYVPQSSYSNIRFSGRFDGTQQLNGYIRNVAIFDLPATKPNIDARTVVL